MIGLKSQTRPWKPFKACGKIFRLCEIVQKWYVQNDPLQLSSSSAESRQLLLQSRKFLFSAITKPQTTFLGLSDGELQKMWRPLLHNLSKFEREELLIYPIRENLYSKLCFLVTVAEEQNAVISAPISAAKGPGEAKKKGVSKTSTNLREISLFWGHH